MDAYKKLQQQFQEKNCTLLSTQEYIATQPRNPKVSFIASCGHENTVFTNVFIYRNTGVVCKECMAEQFRNSQKSADCTKIEYAGFLKLKKYIGDAFECKKLCEGTKADYAIRPKGIVEDAWLALQLKVTTSSKYMYSFNVRKKYDDIIVVLIHIAAQHDLEKFWMFDGNIDVPKRINITKKYSKYDIYGVDTKDLTIKLRSFYDTYKLHSLDVLDIPISIYVQKEREFRKIREKNVPLHFEYPDIEGRVYDFIVNGKRVQEKLATKDRDNSACCFGKSKGKRNYMNYIKDDNDFYWMHLPDKIHFYVIPQFEFLIRGIISYTPTDGKKSITVSPGNESRTHSWTNAYLFRYDTVDIAKLERLINTDYTELEDEVMFVKMVELWKV